MARAPGGILDLVHPPALVGLWRTDPLEQGAMEAAAIGFLPDGVGWHELAKPFSSEIQRFTWQVSAPGQLLIEFTRYLLVRTDRIAGRIGATEVLDDHEPLISRLSTTFEVMQGRGVFGSSETILKVHDWIGADQEFAFDRKRVTPEDDPSHAAAPYPN